MKNFFLTPPIGAWATHGNHKAPKQYFAQLASYIRHKSLASVEVLDCRALELDYPAILSAR